MLKFFARMILRILFRFRMYNAAVLDTPGPVILIPNHVSWLDWLFVGSCLDDDWKFVTSSVTAERNFLFRLVMKNRRTFPVDPASPYAVRRMADHLRTGGRLVLFAEGRLSTTGTLMKLFDGTGFLLANTQAKVITAYLRGAERSKLAEHDGWKIWRPEVTIHFNGPMTPPDLGKMPATHARRKLTDWVYRAMIEQQFQVEMLFGEKTIPEAIEGMARMLPGRVILEDALRTELTARRFVTAAEVFSGVLERAIPRGEERIGVLMPNVGGLPVLLLALWKTGRVPAILNYTSGPAVMLSCIKVASLRRLVTSKAFIENAKLDLAPIREAGVEIHFMEDLRARVTGPAKLAAALRVRLGWTRRAALDTNDPAVVLFTSGSENLPKGVVLTHRNILANIRQMLSVIDIMDSDRIFNALPLFHSFGLTVGLLLPLVRGLYSFLYVSPLHYRLVPTIVYDRECTIMLGTNTFLNGYAQKAHPYDFRRLRCLFAGAEKLQDATIDTWSRRYGVRVLEGYGATECSPCLSVNTPIAPRTGSAGRLLPGIEHRLDPVEGISAGGRLLVRGPNVMKGYLNPDADAKFQALGGWYDTGDIVTVDEDGFIHISGRLKRFAKISGEMVSLSAVEDALDKAFPKYLPRCLVAVLAVKDARRGESLLAVTNEARLTLDEIRQVIRDKGFSNLSVPRELKVVKEIPRLGSGKIDFRKLELMLGGATSAAREAESGARH